LPVHVVDITKPHHQQTDAGLECEYNILNNVLSQMLLQAAIRFKRTSREHNPLPSFGVLLIISLVQLIFYPIFLPGYQHEPKQEDVGNGIEGTLQKVPQFRQC